MANVSAIQILQDGPRNTIVKMTAVLDTANLTLATLIDPALRSSMSPSGLGPNNNYEYAIKRVDWNIGGGDVPDIRLWWDANTDILAQTLNGRGSLCFDDYPLMNNAGTGKTGKILIDTLGYSSGTIEFTLTLWAIKVSL